VDHVPGRVCFPERAYPETFEFPACAICQNATRLDELAFGFFVRMFDRNPENFDGAAVQKLITGMKNNLPHLLPNPHHNTRYKRTALKGMGFDFPLGQPISDAPVVSLDPRAHEPILKYAGKIALALYYREQARIAPSEHYLWTYWEQTSTPRGAKRLQSFLDITPGLTVGTRSNLNFGDRFQYRVNKSGSPDVIATLVSFGKGLSVATLIVEPDFWKKLDWVEGWIQVKDLFNGD